MVAVPVSLVGTLAAMFALGYSINNLTLFGMVLAIGIVVDDAIVVVEAVEFHIARGLSPPDATRKAMSEVGMAIIGVSLVLCAVFVPAAVIPGLTGQFFKQFAVTIAIGTVISAFSAIRVADRSAQRVTACRHMWMGRMAPTSRPLLSPAGASSRPAGG
jgi:multidrug efflux pump